MILKITKTEASRLRQALHCAIDTEESFIDAYRTQWARGPEAHMKPKIVPKEDRSMVAKVERKIAGWKKLLVRMKEA